MPTAAAVIIGDELLTGKARDVNTPLLIERLSRCGVRLERITTIGDDIRTIAEELTFCISRFDHVLTSGGIGPTHDDRTIVGIAQAFGVGVVRHPVLEKLLREHLGDAINEAALKMADVPEGARLVGGGAFPPIAIANVFILPGIPEIFAAKLDAICHQLHGTPSIVRSVFLKGAESDVANVLAGVERDHTPVKVGSYPRRCGAGYEIMVTVEGPDQEGVDRAVEALLERLPADRVVRLGS